jgi:hypothetical protein
LLDNAVGMPVRFAPLALSEVTGVGWYPYARHPAYPILLAAADPVAPERGGLLVAALSLVVLALATGQAAQRVHGLDGRVGFWVVATASPFLIHSQIGWAHLPAAAAVAVAFALTYGREKWSPLRGLGVAAALGVAVLLRTEGVVVGLGLFGAVALVGRSVSERLKWSATIGGAVAVTFAVDRLAYRWITGDLAIAPTGGSRTADSFPVQRMQAGIALFLDVGGASPQNVARLLAALLLIAAAIMARGARDVGFVVTLSALALVIGGYGALNSDPYPGLLAAWPMMAPALILVGDRSEHRLPIVAIVIAWIGLLAISPADGGGLGWGGRLGLVVLVLAAPMVAQALISAREGGALAVMAVGVVLTLAVSFAGLRTVQTARATSLVVGSEVSQALASLAESPDLLISTDRRLGRVAPDAAMALPLQSMSDDTPLAAFLDEAGSLDIDRVVHIDLFDHDLPTVPAGWEATEPSVDGVVRTIILERTGS